MKTKLYLLCLLVSTLCGKISTAQCGVGYTQAQLNWDYLDYMVSTGNYSGFVTTAQAANQNFTIGTNMVNIATSANIAPNGENATHTGDLAGYTGQDAQFTPSNTGTITITFAAEVMNASFSLYDIDRSAVVTVSAINAASVAQSVTASNVGVILTVSGAVSKTFTATSASLGNAVNNGSATVSVTGPVKTITISVTTIGSDPTFWLSDINACVAGSFPGVSWHNNARPFTGMPSYAIIVIDSNFMMLDPATGYAKPLFTEYGTHSVNSLGYDPINRMVYYAWNRTGAGGALNAANKRIYRYSVDAEAISTVSSDITVAPLNVPTFDEGIESAGASFYNGSFYFGVEGANSARNSGRENTIWKLDFDGSLNPLQASQVYSVRADSSISGTATLIHDWSDFGVSKGMIFDFDGASTDSSYFQYDMMTGQRISFWPTDGIKPGQTVIDWQGNVYNLYNTASGQFTNAVVAPYNLDGSMNIAQQHMIFTLPGPINPVGNWADAAEAFRPNCDFGDAPASYDPDPLSPAVNEKDSAIHIGATFDREPAKIPSALANADGSDEDGLSFVPIFSSATHYYLANVSVYNNTGSNATLMAWLDYNGNGVFDASEAIPAITVASMPSMQTKALYWSGITSSIPNGSFTYLRIRMVKGTGTMTSANATGYYDNGETEDYRISATNTVLTVKLLSFNATAVNNSSAYITWKTSDEENLIAFEVQRSMDNTNWTTITNLPATGNGLSGENEYAYTDKQPLYGKSYYRLKLISGDTRQQYSEIKSVSINKGIQSVSFSPNPAINKTVLHFNSSSSTTIKIRLADINGHIVLNQTQQIRKGANDIELPLNDNINSGLYLLQLTVDGETIAKKLMINK